jgi:tetratricopeptide (TPR) repeat protein
MALVQIYLRAGRLDEAEPLLEAAARSAPDDPRVNAARGVLALARGATEDAVRHLSAAQSARPDQIGIGLALAQAQIASGDPGAARATIATQLQRAPESLPLRSALASVELRLGNVDAALAIANALQAEYPELSTGYVIEGDAAIARRQYGAAAETLEEAFAREPSWEIRGRWINALQLAGREDDVLQQYLLAVDDDPANVVALNNAAWILHERGRYDEALPLAERANRAVPDNAAILDTLGWILVGAERAEDAIPHLERAAGMAPEAAEIRYHLATAQARAGHVTEARDELQRLLAGDRQFEQRAAAEELLETL